MLTTWNLSIIFTLQSPLNGHHSEMYVGSSHVITLILIIHSTTAGYHGKHGQQSC